MPASAPSRFIARHRLAWLRRSAAAGTLTLAMLGGAHALGAQAPNDRTGEFQVNTYTSADQRAPSVAADEDGNYAVVWQSYGQDGDGHGVFAQRFSAAGTPLGDEFQINTVTTGSQRAPSVAMSGRGDFVVVWQSGEDGTPGQGGDAADIYGRRYGSDGTPLSNEFQVNTVADRARGGPAVGMSAAGRFVVTWASVQGDQGTDLLAQRYAADGTPTGEVFQVNTVTTGEQNTPAVAMDADGDFVVVCIVHDSSAKWAPTAGRPSHR